jgi:hypothetical protein
LKGSAPRSRTVWTAPCSHHGPPRGHTDAIDCSRSAEFVYRVVARAQRIRHIDLPHWSWCALGPRALRVASPSGRPRLHDSRRRRHAPAEEVALKLERRAHASHSALSTNRPLSRPMRESYNAVEVVA